MNLFGLIGYPLTHSWSEIYFSRKFAEEGISNAKYRLFELPDIHDLDDLLKTNPNLRGFNVTIPYKEKILPYLHGLTPEAKETGAANVVLVERDGENVRLNGMNTDVEGFSGTLPEPFPHKKALILGTGGAAKAVARVLKSKNTEIVFVSRNKQDEGIITYRELMEKPGMMKTHTMIVNATPTGMFPDTGKAPDIPWEEITPEHFLYDLVYNPGNTLFMQKGEARGAKVVNGYNMFTRQAEAAFHLFKKMI
jgi:shikimate dehydrogenase